MADQRRPRGRGHRQDGSVRAVRPSQRATEHLMGRFADELGLSRAAWDDVLARRDQRLAERDTAALVDCLEDQQRLLLLLERRLRDTVSAAAVEREAEWIVGASASGASGSGGAGAVRRGPHAT